MRIITTLAAVAGLAALSACGGGEAEDNTGTTLEANTLIVDNLETPAGNMTMDMNATDLNAATDTNTTIDADNSTANTTTNSY